MNRLRAVFFVEKFRKIGFGLESLLSLRRMLLNFKNIYDKLRHKGGARKWRINLNMNQTTIFPC